MCQETFNFLVLAENVIGDRLLSPHVLPYCLTGNHYRDFILHDLPRLLENVPVAVRARMWYMDNGFLTYFSRGVRDVLNNTYHDR
jgi:hypothetical protein